MVRLFFVVLVVAAALGGWYVFSHCDIDVRRNGEGAIESVRFVPRGSRGVQAADDGGDLPPVPARSTIRIATFNVDGLDENKLANHAVADTLVRVLPHFDVIALQGVRGKTRGLLVHLVEQINATGRCYDFATDPVAHRDGLPQYNALLFDRASVEIDRSTVRFVDDPAGRFRYRPLVAAFRVRGPTVTEAFTFILIDVQVDPARVAADVDLLAAVFRAVRDHYPAEDDFILLGDLESDHRHLGQLGRVANLAAAVTALPTTTRGSRLADNILFDRRATVEFTGRSGVYDLMRECDLSMPAALAVSEHLPVWAEFSVYEGGQPGHVP